MIILGMVLAIAYAALMIFAVFKGKQKNVPFLFIALGCLLVLSYCVMYMVWKNNNIAVLVVGMVGISIGTLLNGIKQKNVHIHHHIIRLIVEAVIIAICWPR